MNPPSKFVRQAISWLITLLIPYLLIMTSVRLILTPVFLQIEYRTPNFPADSYGFTLQDRLHYSGYLINYLVNNAGINYLGDLKFPDGSPLFKPSELSHMVDVKNLVQATLKIWVIGLALLLLFGLWAWRSGWLADFRLGLRRGGWLSVGLIAAILLAVALNFRLLFTDFHRIFFIGNSWIFLYSDTLIRLLPLRFFQDCFIDAGVLTLAGGLSLGLAVKK